MWYLRKIESSCEEFGPVSTSLCPKYIKFCFQNLGNVRVDKNGGRWTTYGFNNEKEFSVYFVKIELFCIFETKSNLSMSVCIFSTIS